MKKKVTFYIFDTNIFLTGIDFNLFEGDIYTTPSIIEEVKDLRYFEKNRNILNCCILNTLLRSVQTILISVRYALKIHISIFLF